jgi:hypothetical protein
MNTAKGIHLGCAAIIAVVGWVAPAHANFECTGQIASINTFADGGIAVDIGHGAWWVCNVKNNVTYGGVANDVTSCKAWLAQLIAAQQTGKSVGLFLSSATITGWNPPECNSVANWAYPGVIMLRSLPD